MTNTAKAQLKKTLIASTAVAIALLIIFLTFNSQTHITIIESATPTTPSQPLTIAQAWQLPPSHHGQTEYSQGRSTQNTGKSSDKGIILDYSFIYEEIGKIRLNKDGSVVIDNLTLQALRKAFPAHKLNLTPELMNELSEIIETGLPGRAGKEASEIIRNYYAYALAKEELNHLYDDINLDRKNHKETLNEIKALRSAYLGDYTSQRLYKNEDKIADYMIDAFEIATDQTLTQEEKAKKHNKLRHEKIQQSISHWPDRYSNYLLDKQKILDSSLATEEKNIAIQQLQQQHFKKEELDILTSVDLTLTN